MLTKLLIFFGVAILVQGSILPEDRIVGGESVTIHEHPYQVALLHRNPTTNAFGLACGGAVFKLDVILTAAQCLVKTIPQDWFVNGGSSYYEGSSVYTRPVRRLLLHERHSGVNEDIAMVFLLTPLPVINTIKPISLPTRDLDTGSTVDMTGWGTTSAGGPISTVLRRIRTQIVDQTRCMNAYSGHLAITGNMVCAGRLGIGGQDFCSRDTGGPLVAQNIVYGIASYTYGCGNPNFPGVYTRVSLYTSWINSNALALGENPLEA